MTPLHKWQLQHLCPVWLTVQARTHAVAKVGFCAYALLRDLGLCGPIDVPFVLATIFKVRRLHAFFLVALTGGSVLRLRSLQLFCCHKLPCAPPCLGRGRPRRLAGPLGKGSPHRKTPAAEGAKEDLRRGSFTGLSPHGQHSRIHLWIHLYRTLRMRKMHGA